MKSITLLLLAYSFAMGISSCKKGEDDPSFTLASRKSRICGEWKMIQFEDLFVELFADDINGAAPGDTNYYSHAIGNENLITTINDNVQSAYFIFTGTLTLDEYSLAMNRDGTWIKTVEYDHVTHADNGYATEETFRHKREVESGTWSFVSKTEDFKNKERVLMTTLKIELVYGDFVNNVDYVDPSVDDTTFTSPVYSKTTNYLPGELNKIYEITQLKSKEMVWKIANGVSDPNTDIMGSESITWQLK